MKLAQMVGVRVRSSLSLCVERWDGGMERFSFTVPLFVTCQFFTELTLCQTTCLLETIQLLMSMAAVVQVVSSLTSSYTFLEFG